MSARASRSMPAAAPLKQTLPAWLLSPGLPREGLGLSTWLLPAGLVLLLTITTRDFLQWQNLANVAAQVTALLLVSLGQLPVVLVGGIDLSVASVISLTGALMATLPNPWAALAAAIAAALATGLVNGLAIVRLGLHPLVMTLATMTVLQGLCLLLLPVPGGSLPAAVLMLADARPLGVAPALPICLGCALLLGLVLRHTRSGLHLYAVGAAPRAAALNGLSTSRSTVGAYVVCSLFGVLAGLYLSARIGTADPSMGAAYALDSVTAVVLGGAALSGGVGSVRGVLSGALCLGLLTNGLNLWGVSPFMRGALTGLLLLLAVGLQRGKAAH